MTNVENQPVPIRPDIRFRVMLHDDLATRRHAGKLSNYLTQVPWGAEVFKHATPQNLDGINRFLGEFDDHYRARWDFYKDPRSAEVLTLWNRLENKLEDNIEVTPEFINVSVSKPATWLAANLHAATQLNEVMYPDPLNDVLETFYPQGIDADNYYEFLKSDLVSEILIHGKLTELGSIVKQLQPAYHYYLENPETTKLLINTAFHFGWHANLLKAQAIMDMGGRGRVPPQIITQGLWQYFHRLWLEEEGSVFGTQWQAITQNINVFEQNPGLWEVMKDKVNEASSHTELDLMWFDILNGGYGEYLQKLAGLRIKLGAEKLASVRANLQALPVFKDRQPVLELQQSLTENQIAFREDRRHPLSHLLATTGIEWEYPTLDEQTNMSRVLIEPFGFSKDPDNNDEIAFAFVHHPATMRQVIDFVHRNELIDVFNSRGHSMHLNLGIFGDSNTVSDAMIPKEVYLYTRFMQGTAWAYYPYDRNSYSLGLKDDLFNYRIRWLRPRIEIKEFAYLGEKQLVEFVEHAMPIATALKAYLVKGPQTPDQKKLAAVFAKNRQDLINVYAQLDLSNILETKSASRPQSRSFAHHIRNSFGKVDDNYAAWREYDATTEPEKGVERANVVSLKVGDARHPNLVAASRAIARSAAEEINSILTAAESDCVQMLINISKASSLTRPDMINAFFKRYPCGISSQPQPETMGKTLAYLFTQYNI